MASACDGCRRPLRLIARCHSSETVAQCSLGAQSHRADRRGTAHTCASGFHQLRGAQDHRRQQRLSPGLPEAEPTEEIVHGTLEKAPRSRSSSAAGGLPLMSAPCLSSTCARSRTSCVATTARRNVPCRAGQNRPPSVPSICQPLPLLDCKLCQTLWRSLQTRSSGDAVTLQNTCTPQLWWSGSHPAKHLYSEARLDPSEAGVLSQS